MEREAPERGGPWEIADYRSLLRLCADAENLYYPIQTGLMGGPQSRYSDIAAARKALEEHQIYGWLQRELPVTLKLAPAASPLSQFRFVRSLVQFTRLAFEEAQTPLQTGKARTDKKLVAAWKAVLQVEHLIDDGTVLLTPQAKCDMLRQLLAEARSELMRPRKKGAKHWVLEALAHALQRDFAISDARIILEVAAASGTSCNERAAQRYVAAARERN
jgi:hypothetical protein